MSVRLTKAESSKRKASNEPPPQIVDLSFNNAGRAFQHPPGFENGPVFINAKEVNSKPYKRILRAAPPENHAKSRVAISLKERENLSDVPEGLRKYLLVGWIPQNASDFPETKIKGGKIIGTTRPEEKDIITYDPEDVERLPLMAVVEVRHDDTYKDGDAILTFALLHQHLETGICTPYTAGADDVFYLSLFRDNSTAKHTRKANWNRMVSKHAFLSHSSNTTTPRQAIIRRARDQSKLVLPPTMSLKNEVGALIAAFVNSKNAWCIDELKSLLVSIEEDLTNLPPANTALRAFAELGSKQGIRYTESDAKGVVDELRIAWPDLALQEWHVYLLGQGILLAQMTIDYEHLQPFLREGIYRIEQGFASGDLREDLLKTNPNDESQVNQLKHIAQSSNETVRRILGFAEMPVSTPVEDHEYLLVAIKKKLAEAVQTDNDFNRMLQKSAGDQALDLNYQDIWGTYCEQCDTDAARIAFMDVVKFTVAALSQKECHLKRLIEGIIELLDGAGI